jgi:hypothetical protein
VGLVRFTWVSDPEFDGDPAPCNECGAPTEALRCEPDRSEAYLTHIRLCTKEGCRRAWPYMGARAERKREV